MAQSRKISSRRRRSSKREQPRALLPDDGRNTENHGVRQSELHIYGDRRNGKLYSGAQGYRRRQTSPLLYRNVRVRRKLRRRSRYGKIPPLARQGLCRGLELCGKSRISRSISRMHWSSKRRFRSIERKAETAYGGRDKGNSPSDGQDKALRRAQLRLLRIRYLPRKGDRHLSGKGGDIDVPALS